MEDRIQEAAELFADRIDDGNRTARQCAILAYKQGATMGEKLPSGIVLSSKIWHDISELPIKKSVPIIGITKVKKKLKQFCFTDEERFRKVSESNTFVKWAYKEDIINS